MSSNLILVPVICAVILLTRLSSTVNFDRIKEFTMVMPSIRVAGDQVEITFHKLQNATQTESRVADIPVLVLKRNEKLKIEKNALNEHLQCNFYVGAVDQQKNSKAALTICENVLSGFIDLDTRRYYVESLPESPYDHILYQPSSTSKIRLKRQMAANISSKICFTNDFGISNNNENEHEYHHKPDIHEFPNHQEDSDELGYLMDSTNPSSKLPGNVYYKLAKRWIKIAIGVDHTLILFHGKSVENYILALMNIVSAVYQDPSLQANVELVITRFVYINDESASEIEVGNSKKSLEKVNAWNRRLHTSLAPGEARHDMAIWLTRADIGGPSGFAPVGGVCDPSRSCALNRDEGLSSAFVIAHEMAHILGLTHDGDFKTGNICEVNEEEGFVMAPLITSTFNTFSWSTCSRKEYYRKSKAWFCTLKPPSSNYFPLNGSVGYEFSLDDQCRSEFGDGYQLCTAFDIIEPCTHLWCGHINLPYMCKTKKGPPLDGTECDAFKVCSKGFCVPATSLTDPKLNTHSPRDGGWSDWSWWNVCSRTCGYGTRVRHRNCNNPLPRNGGKHCEGEMEEFEICNIASCPQPSTDSRAEQCKNLPKIMGLRSNLTWLPYESENDDLKCHLTCISKQTREIFLSKELLSDGTLCSYETPSNICVKGKCIELGCDGIINSTLKEDSCGICSGNSSKCSSVIQEISKDITEGYNNITVLPRLSRNIFVGIEIKLGIFTNSTSVVTVKLNGDKYKFPLLGAERHFAVKEGARFHFFHTKKNKYDVWARGPLLNNTSVAVEVESDQLNSETSLSCIIKYLVSNEHQLEPTTKFAWFATGSGACTVSCGGGKRQTLYLCREVSSGKIVLRKYCSSLEKPKQEVEKCNQFSCSFQWAVGPWEHCSATCGSKGIQKRELYCTHSSYGHQSTNETTLETLRRYLFYPDMCTEKRPVTIQDCNRVPCPGNWTPGNWSKCSATCGKGEETQSLLCTPPEQGIPFSCSPKPLERKRPCYIRNCTKHNVKNYLEDKSIYCSLMKYLGRYCVLPTYRKVCRQSCKAKREYDRI